MGNIEVMVGQPLFPAPPSFLLEEKNIYEPQSVHKSSRFNLDPRGVHKLFITVHDCFCEMGWNPGSPFVYLQGKIDKKIK